MMQQLYTGKSSPLYGGVPRSLTFPVMDFDYQIMEDELTCPVCLELYADPLMLPCSHSVCKKCLQDIITSNMSKAKADHKGIECPSCRKAVKITKDKLGSLPRNLALENIVIRYSEERSKSLRKSLSLDSPVLELLNSPTSDTIELPEFPSESKQKCELCEGSNPSRAAWYCMQCEVAYCHACFSKFHPRRGSLARHKLKQPCEKDTVGDKPSFCLDHETEQTSIFCDGCKMVVCHLCVCDEVGKHAGHKILDLDTAYRKIKDVATETKDCSDSLLEKLHENRSKIEIDTENTQDLFDKTCRHIELQYKLLIEDLTSALKLEKEKVISSMSVSMETSKKQLCSYLEASQLCERHLSGLSEACHNLASEESQKVTLTRATEVKPLTTQLIKGKTETESLNSQYEGLMKDNSLRHLMDESIDTFCRKSYSTLKALIDDKQEESIIPHVLFPSSPGKQDVPRVQNKCLITWGFKSTSFTAEPLTTNATWRVTIEPNTGHVGDFSNGYLFGVGISRDVLNNKDLVGMNKMSHGIVCFGGSLSYCHNGQQEELVKLANLPLTVTLQIHTAQPECTLMTYRLGMSGQATPGITGKKIITDVLFKEKLHPVFTNLQIIMMPRYITLLLIVSTQLYWGRI